MKHILTLLIIFSGLSATAQIDTIRYEATDSPFWVVGKIVSDTTHGAILLFDLDCLRSGISTIRNTPDGPIWDIGTKTNAQWIEGYRVGVWVDRPDAIDAIISYRYLTKDKQPIDHKFTAALFIEKK